jgi:hypothetical protein
VAALGPADATPTRFPRVRLDLPEGYRPVPLDEDPVRRLARTDWMVRSMFPAASGSVLFAAVQHFTAVADLQSANGIAAAALRYARVDDQFTAAYVSFALTPLDYESVEVAAMGIFESFTGPDDPPAEPAKANTPADPGQPAQAGRHAQSDQPAQWVEPAELVAAAQVAEPAEPAVGGPGVLRDGRYVMGLTLPCGPAVALTELKTIQIDAAESQTGAAADLDVGMLQVHVPVKEFQCLFVLTLTTPMVAEFDDYCRDGAKMALSLQFSDPGGGGDVGWRPRGLIGLSALAPR